MGGSCGSGPQQAGLVACGWQPAGCIGMPAAPSWGQHAGRMKQHEKQANIGGTKPGGDACMHATQVPFAPAATCILDPCEKDESMSTNR